MVKLNQKIPGFSRFQALRNVLKFYSDPLGNVEKSIAAFGDTFSTYVGGMYPAILSANPDFIQHVLQKNHRNYIKSPIHFDKLGHFLGNGLLTSEGDYWLRQRRLIQPGFHRKRLAGLTDIMLEEIDAVIERLDKKVATGDPIDICPPMFELAFRVVAKSLFSANIKEEQLQMLNHNITVLQHFIVRQIRQPFLEPWFKVSGKVKHYEKVAASSKQIVLDNIRERKKSKEVKDDLLQMLLEARYEDTGEGMSEKQLLEECLILFVAGHETTANALAWILYLLSLHPEAVEQIRTEVKTVLGDRKPSFEDVPKLEYTLQVIEESMRLFPPAWVTDRVAVEDDEINGIPIPKGTMAVAFIYGAHRNVEYWENPERFDPSRFAKAEKKDRHNFAYLPFGGGPRLCIGNNFALMEMQLALARMVPRFDFELVPGQEVKPYPLITLHTKNGIRMKVKGVEGRE